MILYRLAQALLRLFYEARTHDAIGRLTPAAILGVEVKEAAPWPHCAACGTIHSPRPGKVTCLACERGHHPALGRLIVRRDAVVVTVSASSEERVN
jgi:hypothetical protein